MIADNVPIIDAQALFDSSNPNHKTAREKLDVALKSTGFLVLRNSEVNSTRINEVIDAYNSLFKGDPSIKDSVDMKNTQSNRGWGCAGAERVNSTLNPDYKEFFDCGIELLDDSTFRTVRYYDPNLWPEIPEFREKLVAYFETASRTCHQLLVAIAECLGYPSDYFLSSFTTPMSLLRGNYYPPRPATATDQDYGIAPHTDYGFLTLVASDGVPGLEILSSENEWISVNPSEPGDCVVNFGEMLDMWSGGHARATLHRVVGHNSLERTSCAFFFNPNYDTAICGRRDCSDSDGGGDGSGVVLAGEYLTKRYNETYVHMTTPTNP
jgi:isopenicillin N synthase-like dioxygenase